MTYCLSSWVVTRLKIQWQVLMLMCNICLKSAPILHQKLNLHQPHRFGYGKKGSPYSALSSSFNSIDSRPKIYPIDLHVQKNLQTIKEAPNRLISTILGCFMFFSKSMTLMKTNTKCGTRFGYKPFLH